MSPRISFSHDFSQSDVIPVEQHPFGSNTSDLESSNDFDFCVTESFELVESFPADEFFSGGRIIPTEIIGSKKKNNNNNIQKCHQLAPQHPPPLPPQSSASRNLKKEGSSKEGKLMNNNNNDSKSFWSFKRSSSCGNGYRRSLCPLPLLSRSNSTGSSSSSNTNNKRNPLSKEAGTNKQNSHKHSSSSSSTNIYHQKPPLNNKSHHHHHGSYGNNNSVRVVSPALNVHSANLFGLASIFSNNRDKSKKK
ncbi:hypothetical protein PIB30_016979 [Stylosanthes scabra]|uniref:Uncharacterized protein n=1 Tax=Stylosanthes scabra TaxID=79078 RepID=A0ABU6Z5U5_9FABA|nr:hypothetical protein [Stylosanthes scabra]